MKSQNSEIYFICTNSIGMYWYGRYCNTPLSACWSEGFNTIQALNFELPKRTKPVTTTFEEFAISFPIIHQQFTPFDLAYLQTNYPELLI